MAALNEKERQKLIERRRKEHREKELEYDLYKDLNLKEQQSRLKEFRYRHQNKYVEIAMIFLGTLIPLYLFLLGAKYVFMFFFGGLIGLLGISMAWITPALHLFVWGASVVSAIRRRSILDGILDRFF